MNFIRELGLTTIIFFTILEHVASKLEKIGEFFQVSSISIHAIRSDRLQETPSFSTFK